jgi:spoIIIJ-associated protein
MSSAEGTGRTLEEAVEIALRQLGATREEVDIEVLQEARPALLGLGGRDARVRATRKPTAAESARTFAISALGLMGYIITASVQESPDDLSVNLEGRDLGGLIGRHGRTLDALEIILALHLHRQMGRRVQVTVDAAGYRARREKALIEQAQQAAEQARAQQTDVALDPMEPRDRRIIHLALRDDEQVTTASVGEGEDRHIVVMLRDSGTRQETPSEEE